MDITKTKSIPRKILVLIIAKISRPFEIFKAKICVIVNTVIMKIASNSRVNIAILEVIMKNQNVNPAVTASDLNRGDDVCILNRINECHKTRL